ncbi:hypothetical protein IWQ60_006357 [Tieghemiomyces parasiticus]|uniref:Uncharacterized protein n=1 Tax=Tieghemiomyces parasiticus TaxID=78921 RepID=A0A9W8AAL0_9FUNG|nr:hypothetical protein IWQ60_006357 [Tieghemiomyces parasiticus]
MTTLDPMSQRQPRRSRLKSWFAKARRPSDPGHGSSEERQQTTSFAPSFQSTRQSSDDGAGPPDSFGPHPRQNTGRLSAGDLDHSANRQSEHFHRQQRRSVPTSRQSSLVWDDRSLARDAKETNRLDPHTSAPGKPPVQRRKVSTFEQAEDTLAERGDRLDDAQVHTARMRQASADFHDSIKAYNDRHANKKWYQI